LKLIFKIIHNVNEQIDEKNTDLVEYAE
jgi:hypothetical protein